MKQHLLSLGLTVFIAAPSLFADAPPTHSLDGHTSAHKTLQNDDKMARVVDEKTERKHDFQAQVLDAADTYRELVKGPHGEIPKEVLSKAHCIAVFPKVVSAAVVIGGMHGDGVASCRTKTGWSPIAFYDINGGSLGLQLGAKETDLVLFFMDDDSKTALENGRAALGADVSVVAGKFDKEATVKPQGVIAYSRNAGVYAGASIKGGVLSPAEQASFYGTHFEAKDLLEGKASGSSRTDAEQFLKQLPS